MCGICGLIYYGDKIPNRIVEYQFKGAFEDLFRASMIRGTDTSGLIVLEENTIYTYKNNVPANKLLEEKEVNDIFDTILMGTRTKAIIGHTRAQTKGSSMFNVNNHPIIANKVVGVHNGIICNDDTIFKVNANLKRRGQVDSEVIFRLLDDYLGMGKSLVESVQLTARRLVGSMACAFVYSGNPRYVVLFRDASHTSLVVKIYKSEKFIAFASTEGILDKIKSYYAFTPSKGSSVFKLSNDIVRIDVMTGKIFKTTMIC